MGNIGDIGALGVLITFLAGVTHEAAEHLFGGLLSGKWMYWAALVTGVGVAFGAQVAAGVPDVAKAIPSLAPLAGLPWPVILTGGVVTGFAATKLHGLLSHNDGTETASLSGLAKTAIQAITAPQNVPTSETVPSKPGLTDDQIAANNALIAAGDAPGATEGDRLKAGIAAVTLIQNDYNIGKVDRDATLQAMGAWRAKYPEAAPFAPPGFPVAPA